jgi:hypothetical protein
MDEHPGSYGCSGLDDIKMDITPPSSVDNDQRKELLWEKREEDLIRSWSLDCIARSVLHNKKSKENKIKFGIFGLPLVLIPIILGGISPLIQCNSLISSIVLMFSGLFSGITVFFNFGRKQGEHTNTANKFFELNTDISSELAKPKYYRIACDVYLEQIKNRYNSIILSAPDI